jgi:predicted molibdopterin-dependent oxidoreductase YjgC
VLWIVATNPAVTLPDQRIVRRALERTPLVVLQDVVSTTDTAAFADLLLPAAGWAEKAGTMTNSERGVSRLRAAVQPPGGALPDWRIATRVAERLGFGAEFAWRDDTEVWSEHAATTRGRDCDMSGMTPARLEAGPLRWPCPSPDHPGSDRLYAQASFPTPSGLARFVVPQRFANAETIVGWAKSLATLKMPPPPAWLEKLPLVGAKGAQACDDTQADTAETWARRSSRRVTGWGRSATTR